MTVAACRRAPRLSRSAQECSLAESDDALARFAGKLADRLAALVEAIEKRLA